MRIFDHFHNVTYSYNPYRVLSTAETFDEESLKRFEHG